MTVSTRAYVAVGRDHLRRLRADGRLLLAGLDVVVADSDDEEDEQDAALTAAEYAEQAHGEPLVLVVDVEDPVLRDDAADVALSQVAAILLGADLAWYATQEIGDLPGL